MAIAPRLDLLGQLFGDRSRANMLAALMDGRQWTARELANAASVTPSTASWHLRRLVEADVASVVPHGRHKYYRISRPEVARACESLMSIAPQVAARHPSGRTFDAKLRRLRTCYRHLAGRIAVDVCDALVTRGAVDVSDEAATVTPRGMRTLAAFGLSDAAAPGNRPPCTPCLDWSERRYHLAGRLGEALLAHALRNGWVERLHGTRALELTPRGEAAFREAFGVDA